ncbi:MAG: hypothetical protein Q8K79_14450, partial [Solirubrobacteraceae bacterium]|nr:hypothetical protein [Solirubrobacteraceae bacterium]
KGLIRLTQELGILQSNTFWTATNPDRRGEISWHGLLPDRPDWTPTSRVLAFSLADPAYPQEILALLNAGREPAVFTLPRAVSGLPWKLVVDTAAPEGTGVTPPAEAGPFRAAAKSLGPHAIAVFVAGG